MTDQPDAPTELDLGPDAPEDAPASTETAQSAPSQPEPSASVQKAEAGPPPTTADEAAAQGLAPSKRLAIDSPALTGALFGTIPDASAIAVAPGAPSSERAPLTMPGAWAPDSPASQ